MRIASLGHVLFAAMLIAVGIIGFLNTSDFAPIWQPVSSHMPARETLVYVCAAVALLGGVGLLVRPTSVAAAALLFVFLAVWMAIVKAPFIIRAPQQVVSYETTAESAVLVAAAWALLASFAEAKGPLGVVAGDVGLKLARVLYGLSLVVFGTAHFAYMNMTAPLVPAWLPAHDAWAYFTGGAYIAAGLAIMSGVLARLAAALATAQIGLFTLLIWVPVALAHPDAGQWQEFVVSCALTVGAWVMADSYRGAPWFGTAWPASSAAKAN